MKASKANLVLSAFFHCKKKQKRGKLKLLWGRGCREGANRVVLYLSL